MKISLVIPTRERAEFLAGCLDTALRVNDPDFEIIVSDNCSQDNTAEVVAARSDPRLRYIRTSERCSMRANFENGLQAAKGDYIIFIGDDDGVLPSGIAHLRELLVHYRPEAVSWGRPAYYWPSDDPRHTNGFLRIRISQPYRKPRKQTPNYFLEKICASRIGWHSFFRNASIYHGCISRKLIERVRLSQGGIYFRGAIPDLYACFANLRAMSTPLLWAGHPATLTGISQRSNGTNQLSLRKVSKDGFDEAKAFQEEASGDDGAALIDVTIPSSDALSLDMLDLALTGQPEHAAIDWKAWLQRIRKRVAKMPRQRYLHAAESLNAYCRIKGLADTLHAVNAEMPFTGPETTPEKMFPPQVSRLKFSKIELSGPDILTTVAEAVSLIEKILGQHHRGQGMRYVKWFSALHRARRVTAQWPARTDTTL